MLEMWKYGCVCLLSFSIKNPGCPAALAGEHPGSLYDQLRVLLEQSAFFQCNFA